MFQVELPAMFVLSLRMTPFFFFFTVYSASATLMMNAITQQMIAKRSLNMFSVFLKIKSIKKQKIRKYTTVKKNVKNLSFIKGHHFFEVQFPIFYL